MHRPDQTMRGKIVAVTGATGGIGRAAALALARLGAEVAVIGRSTERITQTIAAIREQTGSQMARGFVADLSSQAAVRQLAGQLLAEFARLDVLVNNAGGVYLKRQESVDGIEYTWALNHLGYFLLTNLLLDRLTASAPARIVSVTSEAQRTGRIDFDDLQMTRRYSGFRAYSQSKLANILFTYELARRLEGTGVTANCLHPGLIGSNFGTNNRSMDILMRLSRPLLATPAKGAERVAYLASSPEVEGVSGKYFVKGRPVPSARISYDLEVARRLWQVSAEMTGLSF